MPQWEYAVVRRNPSTIGKKTGGIWVRRGNADEQRVADGFLPQDVHPVLQQLGAEGFALVAVEVHERPLLSTTYWLKREATTGEDI